MFELQAQGSGYAAAPVVLASFDGSNGDDPRGRLVSDANGNLYGTTSAGGSASGGTVFKISKTAGGYDSTPVTLGEFDYAGGNTPEGGLVSDNAGNLYGTTFYVGYLGGHATASNSLVSTVYQVNASGITTIAGFPFGPGGTLPDGEGPTGELYWDASGNLFGTAYAGGGNLDGVVFEIPAPFPGGIATPMVVASLGGATGVSPRGGVVADARGDLFGTTSAGGANGHGAVFEILHTSAGYSSTPVMLASFGANQGSGQGSLIIDASGSLYGTTAAGGTSGSGTVFKLTCRDGVYDPTITTLASFDGMSDGSQPRGGLLADDRGHLFGTTSMGDVVANSPTNAGTIFEVMGAGFQLACFLEGTRIATPSGDAAVESLAAGDEVLTRNGVARRIEWMGRTEVDGLPPAAVQKAWPVRIEAHAFGPGLPHRALLLSPDHAVFVQGVLIPVHLLLNGTTIVREVLARMVYHHVELDSHDVILAEGLPCESYLNTGNRTAFAPSPVVDSAERRRLDVS